MTADQQTTLAELIANRISSASTADTARSGADCIMRLIPDEQRIGNPINNITVPKDLPEDLKGLVKKGWLNGSALSRHDGNDYVRIGIQEDGSVKTTTEDIARKVAGMLQEVAGDGKDLAATSALLKMQLGVMLEGEISKKFPDEEKSFGTTRFAKNRNLTLARAAKDSPAFGAVQHNPVFASLANSFNNQVGLSRAG